MIPKIGNKGTHGVRYGRGKAGCVRRKISTPAQTMTKASNVPMLVMLPNLDIGKNPAKTTIISARSGFTPNILMHSIKLACNTTAIKMVIKHMKPEKSMAGSLGKYYKNYSTAKMLKELKKERRKLDRF